MSVSQETVDRIRSYAERGTNIEAEQDGVPLSDEAIESYNRKLDETIRSLQEHVKRQEDALREVTTLALPTLTPADHVLACSFDGRTSSVGWSGNIMA